MKEIYETPEAELQKLLSAKKIALIEDKDYDNHDEVIVSDEDIDVPV